MRLLRLVADRVDLSMVDDGLDDLGSAVISLTGQADRLRMHMLLAYVNCRPTKSGVSFTWKGAWEWDPMSGTGTVKRREDGTLACQSA